MPPTYLGVLKDGPNVPTRLLSNYGECRVLEIPGPPNVVEQLTGFVFKICAPRLAGKEPGVLWLCSKCDFQDRSCSYHRVLQHRLGAISKESWLIGDGGDRPTRDKDQLTDNVKHTLSQLRADGNKRVTPCRNQFLIPKHSVVHLAQHGVASAKSYCDFQGWQWDSKGESFDSVKKLHTLAVVETALSWNGAGHYRWVELCKMISKGEYRGVTRKDIAQQIVSIVADMEV